MRHKVRAEYLVELLRFMPAADRAPLLGADFTEEDLADGERLIDGEGVFAVLVRAAQQSGDPSFGWNFGQRLGTTKHGFLGYLARSCNTLREVFVYDTHFLTTRFSALSLSLHDLGASTRVEIRTAAPLGPAWPILVDLILASLAALGDEILPEGAFAAAFGSLVVESHELSFSITMPTTLLEIPLRNSDERLKELSAQQCARALAEHPSHAMSTAGAVAALLAESLDEGTTLETVAKRLALSPRTLRRKLGLDGTSFQKLLDEARAERARHYLRSTDLSIDEVASRLAFRGASSFCQAFKRWTGQSPGQFRASG
jgi:AraC-like DNA-binding protein